MRLSIGSRLTLLFASLSAPALADSVVVIEGPLAPGAGDTLARQMAYYGDYGVMAIGEADGATVRKLGHLGFEAAPVGRWPEGKSLYVADPGHVPPGADVLHLFHGQTLFAMDRDVLLTGCSHHRAKVRREAWTPSQGFDSGIQHVAADPRITALVAQVSKANIQATVTQLSGYHTRRSDQVQATQAMNWLVSQLQAIPGVTVSTDTFNGSYAPNVIAEITGIVNPSRTVVLGAHYDSINYQGANSWAPGADDNASGSAGILEAARILSTQQFENTVRLILFSAEEFGLVGAYHDAGNLAGQDVVGMLNMDMIAHRDNGDTADLDFATNNTDAALTSFCMATAQTYVTSLPVVSGTLTAGSSDHQAYQSNGIPAAFFFEDLQNYSSVIHTNGDIIGTSANDFDLARDITKAFIACAAELAEPVDLAITHTPLADTTDAGGPYTLFADVVSLSANPVATVDLFWRIDGGTWQTESFLETPTIDEWVTSIEGVQPSGNVDYYLVASDTGGNSKWAPSALNPGDATFSFSVGQSTTIYAESFDGATDNGWTHVQLATQDDWQRGAPTGEGGYDALTPFSGSSCWGNDLGIGNFNGIYQSNVDNYLLSPPIDCTGQSGVRLRYQRWLTVEDALYDQASIEVNGTPVWQNPASGGGSNHLLDSQWTMHEVDISAQADNNPSVQVRYRLQSDGGLEFGGWTVDDFSLVTVGDGVVPSLIADQSWIPAGQASVVNLDIDLGPLAAGRTALIAIGVTGDSPGTFLEGTLVPLNFDVVTQVGFAAINSPYFVNFGAVLDGSGRATSTMNLPAFTDPMLPGLELFFAAFTFSPIDVASNSVKVTFGL